MLIPGRRMDKLSVHKMLSRKSGSRIPVSTPICVTETLNHDVTLCLDMPMQNPIKGPRLCHAWTVGFLEEEDKLFAQN